MGFIKKIYDNVIYSEYGKLISSIVLLSFLFVAAFIAESNFSDSLRNMGLISLPFIFEFITLVLTILIVNICRRSIESSNRWRTIVYAMFFSVGVGFKFIVFSNVHWLNGHVTYDSLTILSSLSGLSITLGLMIAALIPMDARGKNSKPISLEVFIFITWVVFTLIMLRMSVNALPFDLYGFDISIFTTVEYLKAIFLIIAFALHYRSYTIKKNKYLLMFMNGIAILIMAQIVRLAYVEYNYLFHFVYNAYLFVGYGYIYNAIFGYNILHPIQNLVSDEKQIKLYAENLEVIVDRRTKEMKNNNERLIQEIEYAKSIQQSLLPSRKLSFNKVTFISEYFPCERLSGDFFDIYRLDDENIGMYVLDVSGHGVSAALMTMFCNNYIKSSEKLIMKYRGLKPHRNLKHFYEEFNKMKFPDEMYMVMFFASYNIETKILTYASGGINCYPILAKKNGELSYLDKSKGFPICKMSSFFTPTFTSETIELEQGDRVIFYTDGLTDNIKNKTISEEELEQVLFDYRNRSLNSLNEKINSFIDSNASASEDDITYFIMEV